VIHLLAMNSWMFFFLAPSFDAFMRGCNALALQIWGIQNSNIWYITARDPSTGSLSLDFESVEVQCTAFVHTTT